MAPNTRFVKALNAMKEVGFPEATTEPVLKDLLKVYGHWELIEEENYRLLADMILEFQENKGKDAPKRKDTQLSRDYVPQSKRINLTRPVSRGSLPAGSSNAPSSSTREVVKEAEAEGGNSISEKEHTTSTGLSLEISLSPSSEVKISLGCSSSIRRPVSHAPCLDSILKLAEEKGLKYQKIDNPDFPLVEMMEKLCQYFLKEVIKPTNNIHLTRARAYLKKSGSLDVIGSESGHKVRTHIAGSSSNELQDKLNDHHIIRPDKKVLEPSRSYNLKYDDISNGREKFPIPVVMRVNKKRFPPAFHYISQNLISQNAHVNCSLARIGDENCCSECVGDCVTSPIPCACARETGGVFAYTADGILRREFLDECISKGRDAPTSHLYYCEDCPLERSSKSGLKKCKGHFLGKFIKECWMKCGCSTQCGNRVVQRGITRKLQVFFTAEGKGWGLRTVNALPRGAFVCEYIGEILTNTELYNRNKESTGDEEHTYPLLLDADWASEGRLEDDHALCLDATKFGNVARFINHRCFDPSLVEIPVEIETPDHHYYHVAFFTLRDLAANEELTWDYGIDFLDVNHPVKAFRCRCGSNRCRDVSIAKC